LSAEQPNSRRACANCDTELLGRHCHACGQDGDQGRLSTRAVLLDAALNFVNWDSALMQTLRGLVRAPGRVAEEFVAGKRKRYVAPARLCLITLALWLIVTRWLGVDPLAAVGFRLDSTDGVSGAQRTAAEIRAFLGAHLDVLLFIALPLRAWLTKRLFPHTQHNLAECYVLVLYVASFGFMLGIALAPAMLVEPRGAMMVRQLLTFAWAVRGARAFFQTSWAGALLRMLVVTVLHTISTALLFGLLALPFVL